MIKANKKKFIPDENIWKKYNLDQNSYISYDGKTWRLNARGKAEEIKGFYKEFVIDKVNLNNFDAYENIMAGAKYIAQKLAQYKGNVDKALAAYNAGSSVVDEYGGVPPYGETQSYVKNVKAIMKRGANVPYANYISRTATKEEVKADLQRLLAEMPEGEEYKVLKNTLAEMNYL